MVQLIPAIDLMNGKIVRLTRGEAKTAKFYDEFGTPLDAARKWRNEGAKKLHIIDLDAAFGNRNNYDIIAEIAENVSISINDPNIIPIQVGGGIRSVDTATKLLKLKISQVILGTLAFSNSEAIKQIHKKCGPESVIVSLDHVDEFVQTFGWTRSKVTLEQDTSAKRRKTTHRQVTVVKKTSVTSALERFTDLGVYRFLITSIAKDGTLSGPDLDTLSEAVRFPNVKIIAAGGIGSINDLLALKRIGVEGAVIGKALYEGRFTLKEAIQKIGA